MKRGLQSPEAQDEVLKVAHRRGHVQRYLNRKGNLCGFTIMCPGVVCFVTAVRLLKLSSTPEDILHEYAAVIGQLRFIASSPAILRELWLRTPRGAWRFFLILDDGILEIDRYGMPLANVVAPAGAGAASGIVMTVPFPCPIPAGAGNEPGSGAGKPDTVNSLAGPDRAQVRDSVPAFRVPPGSERETDPAPGSGAAGPVAENADTAGAGPDQGTVVAANPKKPYEPDMLQYPGINVELVRRFTRWRKEQRKNGAETG